MSLQKLGIPTNPVLERLPGHLLQFVKPQQYNLYTAEDHAIWRYVMRKNVKFLQNYAHESYLQGLRQTGISVDRIPSMYGMNRILQEIGWAAVAVDGLIPTDAFMEFQAYNVLVIASEIRSLEDIEYTPIPDIIHESAGHAPIIANPEYAEFLRRLGQIGCKAISSAKDDELYEAVKALTLLKESSDSSEQQIANAERKVVRLQEENPGLSEMTAIRNLHWWSVEYGLIGKLTDYRIYGAGLLSSIGESKWCLSDKVKKLPYTIACAQQGFDYTKPQPQLFVTPDFAHLSLVLEEFANTMAIRCGGKLALERLIKSQKLGTIELSTGIQITGYFDAFIAADQNRIAYFSTEGKTALAYREKELIGHGTLNHPSGFGSPVGKLKGINLAIEDMSPRDLEAYDIYEGKKAHLEFEGQITVEGEVITGIRNLQGKILLIRFKNCLVKYRDQILFSPDQGIYDMAVGKNIVSGFAGAADLNSFDLITHKVSSAANQNDFSLVEKNKYKLYEQAQRTCSSNSGCKSEDVKLVLKQYPDAWLLLLEWYEACKKAGKLDIAKRLKDHLLSLAQTRDDLRHLIEEGLTLL